MFIFFSILSNLVGLYGLKEKGSICLIVIIIILGFSSRLLAKNKYTPQLKSSKNISIIEGVCLFLYFLIFVQIVLFNYINSEIIPFDDLFYTALPVLTILLYLNNCRIKENIK